MRNHIPLHADMGHQVLNHLARMCDEFNPENMFASVADENQSEVFVAGQAVASAVSELYGDGSCVVYNDIDAFVLSEKLRAGEQNRRKRLATLEYDAMETVQTRYGGLMVTPTSIYAVHSTERNGMVNTVLARPQVNFRARSQHRSLQFLQSFDLNCVQVAVRLSDRKLVWTPAYEQFTASRQLLVMNPKTPLHTAVRYLRKKRELAGAYGNDEHTMELLTAAEQRARDWRRQSTPGNFQRMLDAQLSMGKMYAGKARALGEDLGKWFQLEETDSGPVSLFTLQGRGTPDARLLDHRIPAMVLPTYARALRGHWKKHVCDSILAGLDRDGGRYHFMAVAVGSDAAVDTQRKQQDVALMDKLVREHSRVGAWLTVLPQESHGQLAHAMQDAARRHGQWAFGVFETQEPTGPQMEMLRAKPEEVHALLTKWVDSTIENFRKEERNGKPHRFIVPEVEYAGYRIRELATFQELAEEGVRQCHCVAGYVGSVKEGRDHIISMRKHRSKDSLTLQVSRAGQRGGLRVFQLGGLQNRPATKEERAVAERLVLAASVYATLARLGIRLSPARFEEVLRNEHLLDWVNKVKQLRAGSQEAWRAMGGRGTRSYELKRALLQMRGKLPQFGQLDFFDRQGKHHVHFIGNAPWGVLLKFLLWGDFRDGLSPAHVGEFPDDIPF